MDHISSFDGTSGAFHAIPYCGVVGWQYDGLGFSRFSQSKGINIDRLRQGDMEGMTAAEMNSFLQAWLFFGLLHSVFAVVGIAVTNQDFIVVDGDGHRTITTALLPRLVMLWETCERGATNDSQTKNLAQIDADISQALDFINGTSNDTWGESRGRVDSLMDPQNFNKQENDGMKVRVSVVILLEALISARYTVYMDRLKKDNSLIGGEAFSRLQPLDVFDSFLRRNGWCPFDVQLLRQQDNNTCRYYFSQLDRFLPENHSPCSIDECKLNAISQEEYCCAHLPDCGHCSHVSTEITSQTHPDFDLVGLRVVTNILQNGHTPLVRVASVDDVHATSLQVISSENPGLISNLIYQHKKITRENYSAWAVRYNSAKPVVKYVAISHVWSGGLGNPRSNSLPKCQLARIQKLVNAMYEEQFHPVPFWMDTLCVPLEIEARRLAIRSMKSVYQEADRVLVLDNLLLSLALSSDPVKNLMRIRSTRWLQRLWTFQEGILATSLYFRFSDIAVSGESLIKQMEDKQRQRCANEMASLGTMLRDRVDTARRVLVKARNTFNSHIPGWDNPWLGHHPQNSDLVSRRAKSALRDIRFSNSLHTGTLLKKKHEAEVLSQLSRSLRWRRTTRSKDEALVLANLLGADVAGLLDVRNEITLARVLLSMSSVPSGVLFMRQKHAEELGYGWMPTTFLDGGASTDLGFHEGIVTPDGLNVQLAGVQIEGSLDSMEAETCSLVQIPGYCAYSIAISFRQPASTLPRNAEQKYAIILKNSLPKITSVFGALVSIRGRRSHTIIARWLAVVILKPLREHGEVAGEAWTGKVLHASQRWCIQ